MKNLTFITLNKDSINDFAKERNELLRKAKSKWILFLDTDEELSTELKTEISELNPFGYSGFIIKRKIVFLNKEIGEDKVLRLAKKNSGKWVRKVHEVWQVKGRIRSLKGYIIHNTADNLYNYIKKINTYSSIHATENLHEGKKTNLFKIIFYPKLKFVQNILSGRGFVFSMLQSFHSFLGWVKEWELQKN